MRRNVLIALMTSLMLPGLLWAATGSARAAAGHADAAATGNLVRFDRPLPGFAPADTTLHDADPSELGLDPKPIEHALQRVAGWTEPSAGNHPLYAGAVTLMAGDGGVVAERPTGYELRYADGSGTELPRSQWEPVTSDTIFDLASITKLYTSIMVMQQIQAGRVELEAPVARYLPDFAANGKSEITVRQLLTHTSGLRPFLPLWSDWPDKQSRLEAVLADTPVAEPGTRYIYSDLNLITLGMLIERVSGKKLPQLLDEGITGPLNLTDTGYNPPASKLHRIAATEYQTSPPRGMVRGSVHDENSWSLGGVAGHAGIFATARELAIVGQTILNGGTYHGHRILQRRYVKEMVTNYNGEFPEHSHGLGFELNQRWYMAGLSGPRTAGHTGYTGTSMVLDPASRSVAVLLTNRVHPSREWGSNNPARRAVADGLAQALPVQPRRGETAWFAGLGPDRMATLTTPQLPARGTLRLDARAFVDTEPGFDVLEVQASRDGGQSWQTVPVRASGRGAPDGFRATLSGAGHRKWWTLHAAVPAGKPVMVRFRYRSDSLYQGRGVYLDGIRVQGRNVHLDAEATPDKLRAHGWSQRQN